MKAAWTLLFLAGVTASCAEPEALPPPQSPARVPAPAAAAPPPAAPGHLPTALDLLAAHAGDLALRPDQLGRVKELGKELDATNAPLEQSLAKLPPEPASESAPPSTRRGGGGGFRGGGRGMMGGGRRGMGGGRGAMGGGQPVQSQPAEKPPTPPRPRGDQAQTLRAQMADNHAAAVARAFAVLDDTQQEKAARLLDENDFEPPSVESVQAARVAQKHAAAP